MKLKTLLGSFGAVVALLLAVPAPAQTLASLVRDGGIEWMAGTWRGQTDSGDTVEVSYLWELSPSVIVQKFKSPEKQSRGLIYLDATSGKVQHLDVGTNGDVGKGEWLAEDGQATLKYTLQRPDGEIRRLALVFRKVDADSMDVDLCALSAEGRLGDAWGTMRFRRQK